MNKKEKFFDKLLMSKVFYIIITLIFILIFACVFIWEHDIHFFDEKYVVDNTLLGTFGDFVGGVLGTMFALISILVMIRTFNQQRKVTLRNIEQAESQRFNDIFFELLRLYQAEVADLCGDIIKDDKASKRLSQETINYDNKDFFDFEKVKLQDEYITSGEFDKDVKIALNKYMQFFINNKPKVAACYRTLYRIYDLIDNSQLDEVKKKNYLKIIRAQLTESELFFIRYNCLTYYGEKFVDYINKYNVLKHLPLFDLLEFKGWWKDLNDLERNGINILFHYCTRALKIILEKKESYLVLNTNENGKYQLRINAKLDYYVKISIIIDKSKENNAMEFKGFEKFDEKRLQSLLECYLKEIFIYYNFKRYNIENELVFISPQILILNNNKIVIKSIVQNIHYKPLVLKQLIKS